MKEIDPLDFIFPQLQKINDVAVNKGGLTKREFFALNILINTKHTCSPDFDAKNAVLTADSLIDFLSVDADKLEEVSE